MKMKNDPLKALKFYADKSFYKKGCVVDGMYHEDESPSEMDAGYLGQQATPQLELIMAFVEAYKSWLYWWDKIIPDDENERNIHIDSLGLAEDKMREKWQTLQEGMDDEPTTDI